MVAGWEVGHHRAEKLQNSNCSTRAHNQQWRDALATGRRVSARAANGHTNESR